MLSVNKGLGRANFCHYRYLPDLILRKNINHFDILQHMFSHLLEGRKNTVIIITLNYQHNGNVIRCGQVAEYKRSSYFEISTPRNKNLSINSFQSSKLMKHFSPFF